MTDRSTGDIDFPGALERIPSPQIVDHDRIRTFASGDPSPASSNDATPTTSGQPDHALHNKFRRFAQATMAFEKGRKFSTGTSVHRKRQMSTLVEKEGQYGASLTVCGLACYRICLMCGCMSAFAVVILIRGFSRNLLIQSISKILTSLSRPCTWVSLPYSPMTTRQSWLWLSMTPSTW